MVEQGIGGYGLELAEKYYAQLVSEPYEVITEAQFEAARLASIEKQAMIEKDETESFEDYLRRHAGR